jgi:predicted DNA-binding transcriptional regulator YafY
MVREGTQSGYLANSSDFGKELEVSRRTVARDLDFLRDEEHAPIEYDESRKGFVLKDESYSLPPVRLSRKEVFSFSIARKLLGAFEGTPLEMDMRSTLAKIEESLEGSISLDVEGLTENLSVIPSQEMKRRKDGSLEMKFETTGWKELVRWILSWQPDVKVLSPEQLRKRIELKMRQALSRQSANSH